MFSEIVEIIFCQFPKAFLSVCAAVGNATTTNCTHLLLYTYEFKVICALRLVIQLTYQTGRTTPELIGVQKCVCEIMLDVDLGSLNYFGPDIKTESQCEL